MILSSFLFFFFGLKISNCSCRSFRGAILDVVESCGNKVWYWNCDCRNPQNYCGRFFKPLVLYSSIEYCFLHLGFESFKLSPENGLLNNRVSLYGFLLYWIMHNFIFFICFLASVLFNWEIYHWGDFYVSVIE